MKLPTSIENILNENIVESNLMFTKELTYYVNYSTIIKEFYC